MKTVTVEKSIYDRYKKLCKRSGIEPEPFLDFSMTLFFANEQYPLDLERLESFPDFDFAHDVFGMLGKMDRQNVKLTDCFVPRCAISTP